MGISTPLSRFVLTAALVAVPAVAAFSAPAAASPQSECAKVTLTARPSVNTAMIPETLKSTVTSCASATETVRLVQHLSAPMDRAPGMTVTDKTYTITLSPGQSVTKIRHVPYVCCGTYTVTDTVDTTTGIQLAKATATFTFA